MASARTLSTTELGATRYSQAVATSKWPVQVRVKPALSDSATTSYKLVIPNHTDTAFTHTSQNDLRATIALPIGTHSYKVVRDDQLLFFNDIHVEPGDIPLATTRLASELTERGRSSITQLTDCENGNSKVRYVYAEETHSVRKVYAIGDGVEVLLEREESGDFVGEGLLKMGVNDIRFRVVPREWTRPEIAAFTKLGWDDSAGERGVLVTWPLRINVTKLVSESKNEMNAEETSVAANGDRNGGLGFMVVGFAILVASFAVAVAIGPCQDYVEHEEPPKMTGSIAEERDVGEKDVLSHMRSQSL